MRHIQETSGNNSSPSLYRLKNLIHNCSNNPNCILSVSGKGSHSAGPITPGLGTFTTSLRGRLAKWTAGKKRESESLF